jgi:5-methylcytosine-specific restriction endonuclease McrA
MVYIAPVKKAIPQEVRRAVARRAGATGQGKYVIGCCYCGKRGEIHWMTRCWVYFRDLDLDHVIPESRGGVACDDNIVLACTRCNRSKGFRKTAEQMRVVVA